VKIALGSVQFGIPYGVTNRGGIPPLQEVGRILALAADAGVDTIDTAISYGESERVLGEVGFPGFRIVTKLPALPDVEDVGRWVEQQVASSLERLRVQKVYGLLLHRPMQLLEPRGMELYSALQRLKHDGRVEKVGISVYSPDELKRILPVFPMDLVQVPFNVFDRRALTSGWLRRMKDAGTEVHARSAFLQGLLLLPHGELPEKFHRWAPLFLKWSNWLESKRISALEACLALPLFQDEIDRVVIGVESASQLSQILRATKDTLPGLAFDPGYVDEDLIDPGKWA
jgi:aryl-alcohol dehydrogenase-like predicted oxidoreductase